jgi:membrane protein implicated in regulation of membrane protease activity
MITFFIMQSMFARKNGLKLKTNIDALHHAQAIVTKTIEPNKTGLVKVRCELWPATTLEHATLHPGTQVKIIKVNGNTLIVTQ